jgi:hypothetical protein
MSSNTSFVGYTTEALESIGRGSIAATGAAFGYIRGLILATPISRNGRPSLYVRCVVPWSLRPLVGRSEILKSLDTEDPRVGELRAQMVTGRTAQLFLLIRQHKDTMNTAQLRALVSQYIGERLDEWEDATYSTAGMEALKDGGEWQDSLSLFSQGTVEDCVEPLRSNDVAAIAPIVDEFAQRYKLDVAKGSPQYRTLARELLKAESTIAKEIKQRVQGEYGSDQWGIGGPRHEGGAGAAAAVAALSALASSLPPASMPQPEPAAAAGMLLSEAMKAYQAHYAHMAPGTIVAKTAVFSRFLEVVGDKPVQSIGKKDAIAYRDTLALLPVQATQRYPGLSIREVIDKTKDQAHLQRISKRTINQDLIRGGSGWLDSLGHSVSDAWRVADYAAVSRVVRLSEYTWSGVWPSSA